MLVAVASNKGGVGKTSLAVELAYVLGAVLVDLDWDYGSATRACGVDPAAPRRVSLLEALRGEARLPSTLHLPGRPALVPSHPLSVELDGEALGASSKLRAWASAWQPGMVVDTHPGAASLTYAAMAAADLVVVPVVLAARELDALEGLLAEADDFRIILVPNRVTRWPDPAAIDRLESLATAHRVRVAGAISEHRWWPRRRRRTAVCSVAEPGKLVAKAQTELRALAKTVLEEVS